MTTDDAWALTDREKRFLARIAQKYPADQPQPLATGRSWLIAIVFLSAMTMTAHFVSQWYIALPVPLLLGLIAFIQNKRFNRFKTRLLAKASKLVA